MTRLAHYAGLVRTFIRGCILASLIIFTALFVAALFIEEDLWFQQKIETIITESFQSTFHCGFTTKVERIRLFAGTVELQDTRAYDPETGLWQWEAQKTSVSLALWPLIFHKKYIVDLTLNNPKISSEFADGKPAIMSHIQALAAPSASGIPLEVRQVTINQAVTMLRYTPDTLFQATITSDLHIPTSLTRKPITIINSLIHNGSLTIKGIPVLTQLEETISSEMTSASPSLNLSVRGSCNLSQQPPHKQHCLLFGTWSNNKGQITWTTDDHAIQGNIDLSGSTDQATGTAQFPLAYLCQFINQDQAQYFQGPCELTVSAQLSNILSTLSITGSVPHSFYKNFIIPPINATLALKDTQLMGTLEAHLPRNVIAAGSYQFDLTTKTGSADLVNSTSITLDEWHVPARGLSNTLTLFADGEILSKYHAHYQHVPTKSNKTLDGIAHWNKEHLVLQGKSGSFTYDFLAAAQPYWHLEYCDCSLNGESVISLKAQTNDIFVGTIGYHLLQRIGTSLGWHIPGEGVLHLTGSFESDRAAFELSMKKGNIRIPHTYNLIQDIQSTCFYYYKTRSFSLKNTKITMHKGTMSASSIRINLDKNFTVASLHVPLVFNHCFVSHNKELFALFSGALTLSYQSPSKTMITGFLVLERSHMQSNLFSEEFQRQMFGLSSVPFSSQNTEVAFDVTVLSRTPLHVKTSFLDVSARINLGLQGTVNNPSVSGGLEIVHGTLAFPYKPLLIKHGKLYFLPQQIFDPTIDILAENYIRKYTVRMHITGSVKNPKIWFESTPTLQQEQIIGLLLGGSEDGSLFVAMPTSVMDSIENMVFGPAETTSQFQRTLQNLFKPLKNVRFVPSFSDQTGRGGLRGSLAIEVNDRLRAIIERNFNLTEDTKVEVEYALSDDSSIRGIKDERGDLGGEFETRWKF